jgi:hypothetical protein
MSTLTIQEIARAGITPAYVSATGGGDQFTNNGRVFAQIKNASGGAITVTFATQTTIDGLAVTDLTVSVGATTGDKMVGPFPPDIYNDSSGFVQVTYSGVTSLTIGAFRLP